MSASKLDMQFNDRLTRARSGCPSGLGGLLEGFRPLLDQLARRQLSGRLRARVSGSDLVQETMLTASQGFDAFRGSSKGELRAWLLRILQARLVDGFRRHVVAERRNVGSQRSDSFDNTHGRFGSPSAAASLNEQSAMLMAALAELPELDRSIVMMRYAEQLGFEEVADRLGLPVANVWRRWSRSIDHLRRHLGDG
jgi:RNA polymerase sigma-70 factor (ECF subfamily)